MPGQPFPVTQCRGMRIRQKTRDLLFVRWDLQQMWCALRGHILPFYPPNYNYVLICRRCHGCAERAASGARMNTGEGRDG